MRISIYACIYIPELYLYVSLLPSMVMVTMIEQGAWTDNFQRSPQPKLFCVSLPYVFKWVACNLYESSSKISQT